VLTFAEELVVEGGDVAECTIGGTRGVASTEEADGGAGMMTNE